LDWKQEKGVIIVRAKAFTLIELLIVVAIIAILAAIALPNFLEAQTRSKVSRVHNDLRVVHLAVECYFVDFNNYPRRTSKMPAGGWWQTQVTTPIAYITSCCRDPFCKCGTLENEHYQYAHCEKMKSFITISVGPDTIDEFDEVNWKCPRRSLYPPEYDPTNGTVSRGDVWRLNKHGGPIKENL